MIRWLWITRPDRLVPPVLQVPSVLRGYYHDAFMEHVDLVAVVFPERSTPKVLFELIARHRPTILVNVPLVMRAMVTHPEAASADQSSGANAVWPPR